MAAAPSTSLGRAAGSQPVELAAAPAVLPSSEIGSALWSAGGISSPRRAVVASSGELSRLRRSGQQQARWPARQQAGGRTPSDPVGRWHHAPLRASSGMRTWGASRSTRCALSSFLDRIPSYLRPDPTEFNMYASNLASGWATDVVGHCGTGRGRHVARWHGSFASWAPLFCRMLGSLAGYDAWLPGRVWRAPGVRILPWLRHCE